MTAGAGPFTVLVVCTGNICRSPQAAALLQARAEAAGAEVSAQIQVTSAGTHALIGAPMDPMAAELLSAYRPTHGAGDADAAAAAAEHRGIQLSAEAVKGADLVLCMTLAHRRAVVRQVPGASRRTFLLNEFVALLEDLARDPWPDTGSHDLPTQLRQRVDAAAARRGLIPKGSGEDEEIIDPYRRDTAVYRESAAQLDQALQRLYRAMGRLGLEAPQ